MAIYAIGDVHGCYDALQELLALIRFRVGQDRLWFVGDLINRGPASAEVVRLVMNLGDVATVVMGNHEVRLATAFAGVESPTFKTYMAHFVDGPDRDDFARWVKGLSFAHGDLSLGFAMVHAGVLPCWTVATALAKAKVLNQVFQDDQQIRGIFVQADEHGQAVQTTLLDREDPAASAAEQLLFDLTVLTRVRLCNADGVLLWPRQAQAAGLPDGYQVPPETFPFQPWYRFRPADEPVRWLYGHWAAAGLSMTKQTVGLDSACVYGGKLTAIRLDDPTFPHFQVACPQYLVPGEE